MNLKYYQKDIECMSKENLKKLQGERLVKQFRHVYENVEFYRKSDFWRDRIAIRGFCWYNRIKCRNLQKRRIHDQ